MSFPRGRWELAAAAAVTLAAAALTLSPIEEPWRWLPVTFAIAAVAGFVLPGYVILSLWGGLRTRMESRVELLAASALLSVFVQVLSSIVALEAGISTRWVVLAQLASIAVVLGGMWKRNTVPALTASLRERRPDAATWFTAAGLVSVVALAAMAFAGSGYIDRLTATVARKLAEHEHPTTLSIIFIKGQALTYLYDPLAFMIAWISTVTHSDVIVVTDKFWAIDIVMTALFGASFVVAATRRRFAAAVFLAFMVLYVLKYPLLDLGNAGLLMPYPNRYGFGPGVLVPAGFWLMVRFETSQRAWPIAVLLPLQVFGMISFHAREAVLMLMVYGFYGVATVAVGPRRKEALARYGAALLAAAVMLGVYTAHHRRTVKHMPAVTAELKQYARAEWDRILADGSIAFDHEYFRTFPLFVGEYEYGAYYRRIAQTQRPAVAYPLIIVALLLPLALPSRRPWGWFGVSAFTLPLLILTYPLLYAPIILAVGTPDLFHCETFLYSLTLLLLVTGWMEAGRFIGGVVERGLGRVSALQPKRGWCWTGLIVASNSLAFLAYRQVDVLLDLHLRRPIRLLWLHLGFTAAVLTLMIAVRLIVRRWPAFAQLRDGAAPGPSEGASVLGCLLVGVLGVPAIWNHRVPDPPFDRAMEISREENRPISGLIRDYDRVVRRVNMHTDFSVELVRFMRESIPPGRVFLADSGEATDTPLYANHFVVHGGHVWGWDADYYRDWYSLHGAHLVFNDRPIEEFWQDNLRFLQGDRANYLLVPPAHREKILDFIAVVNQAGPVFSSRFDDGRYAVFEVHGGAVQAALDRLRQLDAVGELRFGGP